MLGQSQSPFRPPSHQSQSILEDIRSFRIPVDFIDTLDAAKVPYYDGRLIVDLFDWRAPPRPKSQPQSQAQPPSQPQLLSQQGQPEKPDRPVPQRVVLHPNDETIWADLLILNAKNNNKFSDREIIRIEAAYIVRSTLQVRCGPNTPTECHWPSSLSRPRPKSSPHSQHHYKNNLSWHPSLPQTQAVGGYRGRRERPT
jgi:hypothetical protein